MVVHAHMSGALLVSISRANGDDLAGTPVHFTGTEAIDDLLVTFTTEQAEVEVTLTGLREPDDPETVLVMLFSEDPGRCAAGPGRRRVRIGGLGCCCVVPPTQRGSRRRPYNASHGTVVGVSASVRVRRLSAQLQT